LDLRKLEREAAMRYRVTSRLLHSAYNINPPKNQSILMYVAIYLTIFPYQWYNSGDKEGRKEQFGSFTVSLRYIAM